MKIRVDKIENGAPHGLSVLDVKHILTAIPPGWITGLTEVRLANGSGTRAYMMRSDGRLIIYSRRGTKRAILRAILSALAAPALNITHCVARGPSTAEQQRLNQFIQPYVDVILPRLAAPKKQSAESHAVWKPVIFTNDTA